MAAAWMTAAPRSAVLLVGGLSLLVYAAVLIFLMLWEGTVQRIVASAWLTATNPTTATWMAGTRGFASVWEEWNSTAFDGWFGPAELTIALVLLFGSLLVLVLGWLSLPLVHRAGSVRRAYGRAVRASVLILSPLAVATAVCGAVFIILEHRMYRRGLDFAAPSVEPGVGLFVCIGISLWLLVWWLQRALAGAVVDEAPSARTALCEGCGYDLTHQPAEGRCPECGLAITASLVAESSRPGSPWAQRKTTASWLTTSYEVLVRPRVFYRRLRLRTPPVAEKGFAIRHYVGLACGGALWGGLVAVMSPPRVLADEFIDLGLVFCGLMLMGLFGCWLGHRTIAALVTSWWLARRALPDTRWAEKVVAYETAFLWAFCVFWGTLIGSYLAWGQWLSQLVAPGAWPVFFVWGAPIEVWGVLGGTLALGVLWLWRYDVAYRSIRWSNF
jgi:hypothetical protein